MTYAVLRGEFNNLRTFLPVRILFKLSHGNKMTIWKINLNIFQFPLLITREIRARSSLVHSCSDSSTLQNEAKFWKNLGLLNIEVTKIIKAYLYSTLMNQEIDAVMEKLQALIFTISRIFKILDLDCLFWIPGDCMLRVEQKYKEHNLTIFGNTYLRWLFLGSPSPSSNISCGRELEYPEFTHNMCRYNMPQVGSRYETHKPLSLPPITAPPNVMLSHWIIMVLVISHDILKNTFIFDLEDTSINPTSKASQRSRIFDLKKAHRLKHPEVFLHILYSCWTTFWQVFLIHSKGIKDQTNLTSDQTIWKY